MCGSLVLFSIASSRFYFENYHAHIPPLSHTRTHTSAREAELSQNLHESSALFQGPLRSSQRSYSLTIFRVKPWLFCGTDARRNENRSVNM